MLLIIFMVIVPTAPLGLDAELPTAGSPGQVERVLPPVLVEVTGDADMPSYRVDHVAVPADAVQAELARLMASRATRQMLVRADARLDFRTVSNVVDAGKAAGVESVGLLSLAPGR